MSRATKIRTAAVAGAVLVLALAAAYWKDIGWSLRHQLTRSQHPSQRMDVLPPCPKCNVVLVSLDTLRADRLGFMGCGSCRTPNLDKIAQQAAVFTSAYTNAWFTTPSHITLFTSLFPSTHQVESRSIRWSYESSEKSGETAHVLDKRFKTLAEILSENGFETYFMGPQRLKFFVMEEGFGRGFQHIEGTPFRRGMAYGTYSDLKFDPRSLAPLASGGPRKFLFLHSYITHSPYFLTAEDERQAGETKLPFRQRMMFDFADRLNEKPEVLTQQLDQPVPKEQAQDGVAACANVKDLTTCFRAFSLDVYWHAVGQWQRLRAYNKIHKDWSEETAAREIEHYRLAYDRGVEQLDRQIGEMWNELERIDALKNTIVVLFSDHGEELFEHGSPNHSNFYEHTAHVPLMIFHPALKTGVRAESLVSLVDVMPSLLELTSIPAPAQVQGKPLWKQTSPYVFGFTMGTSFVRDREWKLMRDHTGVEELYFLPLDPAEQNDLIKYKNPWSREAYARLKHARESWQLEQTL